MSDHFWFLLIGSSWDTWLLWLSRKSWDEGKMLIYLFLGYMNPKVKNIISLNEEYGSCSPLRKESRVFSMSIMVGKYNLKM